MKAALALATPPRSTNSVQSAGVRGSARSQSAAAGGGVEPRRANRAEESLWTERARVAEDLFLAARATRKSTPTRARKKIPRRGRMRGRTASTWPREQVNKPSWIDGSDLV